MNRKRLTTIELVAVLRDMANVVEGEDSFGGSLEYEASDTPSVYEVNAAYRVGNSMGQGGVILIGE